MLCKHCGSNNTGTRGVYRKKDEDRQSYRYGCNDCKKFFIIRTQFESFRRFPDLVREKVIALSRSDKGYINKFDNSKKSIYSTREIARLLGISKSYVQRVIAEDRREKDENTSKRKMRFSESDV